MQKKNSIFAMYLPQYHCIPENDKFWGKGFTDWVTVKKAQPQFAGHEQPKKPLNGNYYDLSIEENIRWQAKLAKNNGISGFGIYHYWFNNEKNILTKPAEIILKNKNIDIEFFFAWDNGNWKRSWSNVQGNDWAPLMENKAHNNGPQILIPYILGKQQDWKNHFLWLLPYFTDSRYVRIDGKPIFVIYNYSNEIYEMASYWNVLAKEYGIPGICVIFRNQEIGRIIRKSILPPDTYRYNYEPMFSGWGTPTLIKRIKNKVMSVVGINEKNCLRVLDYDKVWRKILINAESKYSDGNTIHGAFVSYDDTPRRGTRGIIIKGGTPEKFKIYLKRLIEISESQEKPFILLTAWNEWGEGAFLEPDEVNGYAYLDVIKEIMM